MYQPMSTDVSRLYRLILEVAAKRPEPKETDAVAGGAEVGTTGPEAGEAAAEAAGPAPDVAAAEAAGPEAGGTTSDGP